MSAAVKKAIPLEALRAHLTGPWAATTQLVDGSIILPPDSLDHRQVIVAVDNLEMKGVLSLSLDQQAQQICQTNSPYLPDELNASALMLKSPEVFLRYPVASILRPAQVSEISERELTKIHIQFHRASEKMNALSQLQDLLTASGRPGSLISDACLVADEMFTNAIFNAPFVDAQSGFNPGIDRNDWSVEMGNGLVGELMVGHDENRLVIACRDPFGSLNVPQVLKRIRDCCEKGVSANMRMGPGGAGIGSFMVFNASSSLYLGVQRKKCTVVAATIHWKVGARRRTLTPKNLHCISFDGEE